MNFKKFGNFNWIEMDSSSESGFDTNETNSFLSTSIHFRLLGSFLLSVHMFGELLAKG